MRKKNMERLVVLPFSFGCASHSSVQLGAPKRPKADDSSKATIIVPKGEDHCQRSSKIKGKMMMKRLKPSSGFLVLPKPNVAAGIQRLIRGIKSLSQLFFYKEDVIEEEEPEMEIGYPTDVKHVTHIGLDGSTTTINNNNNNNNNIVKSWDNNNPPNAPEFLCLSPISVKQFELAMNAQAHQQSLVNHPFSNNCD
ncbi:CRIB domain-containing protein RIC4 isoform X2 [Arachis ipaensis]|uniref:CRIB domain-containing protein RIC4 isoform X2 n=1 Tax=Arachis ipaensis TaxID=130454 RepID=UPI0007AF6BB1|nr:CRIB domain-containing protein RIC4 isoform X2 [Arachis ipaensis]XP_025650309.1 CRIB domain-containing protein RIC4-like isoform X2 [Arachis hypogaea]XP_025697034.1 CRIB domain-containing protein RIC4-like isoform X2 [Arachis hypogaea]